jgi:hypothetical protein
LSISLHPIRDQENPVWQQHLEAVSDLEGPHFHARMTLLARYAQYLFYLQHNTARTGMHQHTRLMAYKESATVAAREVERLRHENAVLCSGACSPSEQDRELQEVYHCLSNIEHGWNHTRMLEERAELIVDLEQQLLGLQVQAPPEPADPEEIDAMSGIDEN